MKKHTPYVIVIAVLYWAVSMFAYNWRHPELTQMQMMHNTPEAMTWK